MNKIPFTTSLLNWLCTVKFIGFLYLTLTLSCGSYVDFKTEADTGFPKRGGVGYRGYGFSYLDLL